MSTANVALSTSRDILLDAESEDAERVKRELISRRPKQLMKPTSEGTGLIGDNGASTPKSSKEEEEQKACRKEREILE